MGERIKKIEVSPPLSLKQFHAKRNTVLVWHDKGGLGDVLMQRMLFRDFKRIMPEGEFVFACLPEYMEAAKDHPLISRVVSSYEVNPNEYICSYKTCVTVADRYENKRAPFCVDHRADIWAKYCGVTLSSHDMDFRIDPLLLGEYRRELGRFRRPGTPIVLFAPVSKMVVKTLLDHQIAAICEEAKSCTLLGLHKCEIPSLTKRGISGIYGASLREMVYYVAAADYVISVDTAAFHLAGGLKKPLMGVFTFADGKVYGKHFNFVLVQKHRDDGNWDCGPCFTFNSCPKCRIYPKPCLTELSEEELRNGVRAMFTRWPLVL